MEFTGQNATHETAHMAFRCEFGEQTPVGGSTGQDSFGDGGDGPSRP